MAHLTASELTALTCAAVTDGTGPGDNSLDRVTSSLAGATDPDDVRRHLSTLAALLYARTDPIDDAVVDAVAPLVSSADSADDVARAADDLFAYFASTANAPDAWRLLTRMCRASDDASRTRRLLRLAGTFVQWREDLVDLEQVLALAEHAADAEVRADLLDHAVDRLVFSAPEQFTPGRLEPFRRCFGESPRFRYVLANLLARRDLPTGTRGRVEALLRDQFPYRDLAADILRRPHARVLVVVNIRLGQGDEIVRVAPLVQALLDFNQDLQATVVSRRSYLWDAPRVTTVPIADPAGTDTVFADAFDGVIEIFQPDRPEFAYRLEAHEALERLVARSRPAFLIRAELGQAHPGDLGIRSEFLFQHVELRGQEIAAATGLDRRWLPSIYEPTLRLLAELGLPARVAGDAPASPLALAGLPSGDAIRIWHGLVADALASRTPVALVNPFGGAEAIKGFSANERLGDDLAGLVDEGFIVIVVPNGTEWGRRTAIEGALAHLDADTRARIRIAPDPAEQDPAQQVVFEERTDLPYADRVMRLLKYFAAAADLVVTIEGWMAHLAYNMGRPLRLSLAAGSFTPDWYPYGRGREQRLVPALSTRPRPRAVAPPRLRGDNLPLVHPPRKRLLELAMAGLGQPGDDRAMPALRRALASPDPDLRVPAVQALAAHDDPAAHALVKTSLADREPRVVRAAADRLLRSGVDCTRELGPRYREVLEAHLAIVRGDWAAVRQGGAVVLPAVFAAARSRSYVVARDARAFLRETLSPFMPEAVRPADGTAVPASVFPGDEPGTFLLDLLTRPDSVVAARVATLAQALEADDEARRMLALAGAASALYARPDLFPATLVGVLTRGCAAPDAPETFVERAVPILRFLASGPHAARVWTDASALLVSPDVREPIRIRLLEVLRELLEWNESLVGLDELVRMAEYAPLTPHHAFLFDYGIERLVHADPCACSAARLARLAAVFGAAPRLAHVMRGLAARAGLPADGRAFLTRTLSDAFPHQGGAMSRLGSGPRRVFVMMNTAMGLGDELVRVGPLTQALVDANPALTIIVATRRAFLYDHPRIDTLTATDSTGIAAALANGCDALVNIFQPEAPDFTYNPEAQALIDQHVATHPPAVRIDGDAGRACAGRGGRRSPFLFQRVEIGGRDIAADRQLDTPLVASIYDPVLRLVAELGLTADRPEARGVSVFVAKASPDAEGAWRDLLSDAGPDARPVALVNPFGGSEATKGFVAQEALLAAEITGLVREGYRVVILPSPHAWGRGDVIAPALALLDAHVHEHVRVAGEPAETRHDAQEPASDGPGPEKADEDMRRFKYFAAYADLIVTVEGWLAHLAFLLDKPFRLFFAAGSFPPEWFPRPRAATQRLVTELSPGSGAPYARSALLGEHDPPPLAHRPRKVLLEIALAGLAELNDARTIPLFQRALTSPDHHVRTWALNGLGRSSPLAARGELLAALNDRWAGVVGAAAEALLNANVDCSRELGPRYRQQLQLHVHIARQEWAPVRAAGAVALPALFRASTDGVYDVRAGAKDVLRELLPAYMKGRPTIERP